MPKIEEQKGKLLGIIETSDKEENIPHTIFDAIQEHCVNDMTDVFERLKNSNKQIADVAKTHK